MLPSKLNLEGRTLEDIQREFNAFLLRLKSMENETNEQRIAVFNGDVNGWINWLNSVRK